MTKDILAAAGIQARRNRFPKPPAGTYAVWMDDIETDGADNQPPAIFRHDVTIEVYEPKPDDDAEAKLEAAMSAYGRQWTKQDRYWLQAEQLYQIVYEFTYVEKRRN
jgi:hypothetical protein